MQQAQIIPEEPPEKYKMRELFSARDNEGGRNYARIASRESG